MTNGTRTAAAAMTPTINLQFVRTLADTPVGDEWTMTGIPTAADAAAAVAHYRHDGRPVTVYAENTDGVWLGVALTGDGEVRVGWAV